MTMITTMVTMMMTVSKKRLLNTHGNWAISRTLIGLELYLNKSTEHGNDVMLAQFVFLFFARDFPRNFSLGAKRAELWTGEGETTLSPPQTTARPASLADIYTVFFFFAFFTSGTRPRLEKLRRKRGVKTVNVIVKNKSTTIFHGLWSETKAFFEHSDIISMVDKSTDHAKLLFICQIVSKNHSQRNFSWVYYICIKNIADLSRFNTIYLGF